MHRLLATSALALLLAAPPVFAQDQDQPDPNPVVAVIDGVEVRRDEVLAEARELPEQFRQVPLAMIYEPLLNRIVDSRLLAAEAERRALADDPAVQSALDRARAEVMRDALVERVVADSSTDEALQALYEARRGEDGFTFEEVHARHILLESEDEAQEVIALLEDGADFQELARERSIGPSGPEGGDLGFFRREQMVPAFAEAAFAMEAGSFGAEPVETQFGWHVILVEDRRMSEPAFAELEPELRQQLAREAVTELLEEMRAGAEITLFDLDGGPLPEAEDMTPELLPEPDAESAD